MNYKRSHLWGVPAVFLETFYQGARTDLCAVQLADFPRLSAAGCEGRIKEEEIREALKSVGLDKSPGIDGLPYEMYLRLSHMFVPLLATIYDNWMRQGTIPRRFTRGIVKLLRKNKHGGDGISNFRSLTMLNTDLKIFAKILANCLQTVLPSLICPEQTCAVKGRTIQDNLHLVRTIIEKKSTEMPRWSIWISPRPLIGLTMLFWRLSCLRPASGCIFDPGYVSFMRPPESWWR